MENLEELKREANRFRSGRSVIAVVSEYKIVSALRIKKLVAKRLCIKEEDFSNTVLNLNFFIGIIGRKKDFSIEGIRLDLINGVDIEEIAMKYCEPIEVILEIKDRGLRSEEEVVASKIYTALELARVFNKNSRNLLMRNKILNKIREESSSEMISWWTGEKILNNYNKITNLFINEGITVEGKKYITFINISSMLNISERIVRSRVQKGRKLFGVKISIIRLKNQSRSSTNRTYALLSDVLEAKKNKKYYVKHSDVFDYDALAFRVHQDLKELYKKRFSKEISFMCHYIKKENLYNFIELSKEFGYYKDEMIIKR